MITNELAYIFLYFLFINYFLFLGLSKEHKPQPPRANAQSFHQKSDSKTNQKSGRRGRILSFKKFLIFNFLKFEKIRKFRNKLQKENIKTGYL